MTPPAIDKTKVKGYNISTLTSKNIFHWNDQENKIFGKYVAQYPTKHSQTIHISELLADLGMDIYHDFTTKEGVSVMGIIMVKINSKIGKMTIKAKKAGTLPVVEQEEDVSSEPTCGIAWMYSDKDTNRAEDSISESEFSDILAKGVVDDRAGRLYQDWAGRLYMEKEDYPGLEQFQSTPAIPTHNPTANLHLQNPTPIPGTGTGIPNPLSPHPPRIAPITPGSIPVPTPIPNQNHNPTNNNNEKFMLVLHELLLDDAKWLVKWLEARQVAMKQLLDIDSGHHHDGVGVVPTTNSE